MVYGLVCSSPPHHQLYCLSLYVFLDFFWMLGRRIASVYTRFLQILSKQVSALEGRSYKKNLSCGPLSGLSFPDFLKSSFLHTSYIWHPSSNNEFTCTVYMYVYIYSGNKRFKGQWTQPFKQGPTAICCL